MTIDRITKYGEIGPDSPKLDDDEILRQPILRNLDNGKYIPLSDANPMTQTILERLHGTGNMMSVAPNSIFHSAINLRKNSSDANRSEFRTKRHDDGNMSSSDSSSAKSGHTTALSTSSEASKSSPPAPRKVSSVKQHLTKLVAINFLRRKKKVVHEQQAPADLEDEEDDGERILINDGSNGDLKYKASRHVKDAVQFDKTQLLQTIVNAHNGPIWCMR